jgi:hypothetical protein
MLHSQNETPFPAVRGGGDGAEAAAWDYEETPHCLNSSAPVKINAVTQAEFIAKIKLHLPQGRASSEALALVTEAIRAFPDCAELWLLHGWVTVAAAECDVADGAPRSFEMAIKIDPSMTEARAALDFYRRSALSQSPRSGA